MTKYTGDSNNNEKSVQIRCKYSLTYALYLTLTKIKIGYDKSNNYSIGGLIVFFDSLI